MNLFGDIFRGKRILVTGHTGFKGSWLTLWLDELGAEVAGVSLSPQVEPNHWNLLGLNIEDYRLDIRDYAALQRVFDDIQPEIVFHLAAQPLVRRSYHDPVGTWSSNVMGTANVLESCRQTTSVRAIVAITSDKCYENRELTRGYREQDRLGGHDPYSASKAAAELLAASYRAAYFEDDLSPLLATARAGNVIGGGDWSEDRLIPDLVRALEMNRSLEIRSPHGTRPWQHVLESLSGYLLLGQKLLSGDNTFAQAWNFGPNSHGNLSVAEVLGKLNLQWEAMRWHVTSQPQPHEASLLYLDSSHAFKKLGWQPVWNIDVTIEKTAEWYRSWLVNRDVISRQQLDAYVAVAAQGNIGWAEL